MERVLRVQTVKLDGPGFSSISPAETKEFAVNKYSSPKYKYEYKYLVLKYEYKYKYLDLVLEYNSSTSTCTKYYSSSHFDRQGLYLLLFC